MFPLLIPLLLGGGAVLVATQASRKRKRGESVPPAVTRADPFEGYDQWNAMSSEPIRQSAYRAVVVRRGDPGPTPATVRATPRWEPDDDEAERPERPHPATRTRRRDDSGPRRPRQVGPAPPSSAFARDVLHTLVVSGLSPDDAVRVLRPFEPAGLWLGPYTLWGTRQVEADPVRFPGFQTSRRVKLLEHRGTKPFSRACQRSALGRCHFSRLNEGW